MPADAGMSGRRVISATPGVAPSDVAQSDEHPGLEVVEQMAMERPKPGIVGVEGDDDPAPRTRCAPLAPP